MDADALDCTKGEIDWDVYIFSKSDIDLLAGYTSIRGDMSVIGSSISTL